MNQDVNQTVGAPDAAKELGMSVLYIHRVLRATGIEKMHGVYMIDEPTMRRLKAARAAAPTKVATIKRRGVA